MKNEASPKDYTDVNGQNSSPGVSVPVSRGWYILNLDGMNQ